MKHYYFIGIGGIGMSGLAKILISKGHEVSGSDIKRNGETEKLEALGATIFYGQNSSHLNKKVDVVVYTSAIPEDNPDLVATKELGINLIARPELLNQILSQSKGIAVTGTHGKTTVSSMLSLALIEVGLDPTIVVGAEINELGTNARAGEGEYSIAEVCEYKRAFLDIYPFGAIITNIDADHLDCYKDLNDIKTTFAKFVSQIDKNGFLAYCTDDKNAAEVAIEYQGKRLSYGTSSNAEYQIINTKITETKSSFEVAHEGKSIGLFTLSIPGKHNILNAAGVVAICDYLGVNLAKTGEALTKFSGADRRFQTKGKLNGAVLIDDYAHHPTEIMATLAAARDRYPDKRIIAVFQPHQHSRTKLLLEDFGKSFSDADMVILPEIYAVRDTKEDINSVSSATLADKINKITPGKAIYIPEFTQVENKLREISKRNDVILTIGAGPVNQIAENLV